MLTDDFDYHLPSERIAQRSVEPRDHSRLLVVDRQTHGVDDRHFYDLPSLLHPGDLLVLNDTKVFRARLHGTIDPQDKRVDRALAATQTTTGQTHSQLIEVFLLRPTSAQKFVKWKSDDRQFLPLTFWEVLLRPGRKVANGSRIKVGDGTRSEILTVVRKSRTGTAVVASALTEEEMMAFANRVGEIPVPPYIHTRPERDEQYQTVYAKRMGSVAAPTSGFHFTDRLMAELKAIGIQFATVTLHVGLGTFKPIKTDRLEDHPMHAEWAEIPQTTVDAIAEAKKRGGRVIAVGTTTTRTLEGVVAAHGKLVATAQDIPLFIIPGFRFQMIDGLITNFHLPRTTLLSLVAAFLGSRDRLISVYHHALDHEYRFASFGDAMLIV